MRRTVILVVLACATAFAAAPALGGAGAAATGVKIGDNFFKPRSTTVGKGGSVTWVWRGKNRHNVSFIKAPKGAKPSTCRTQRKGKCARRFKKAGKYSYVCTLHGSMTGSVRVR